MSESRASDAPGSRRDGGSCDLSPARVPYTRPRLRSYGNIRDITRDVGPRGVADSYPPTKPKNVKSTAL
jgi:hypothetical protein